MGKELVCPSFFGVFTQPRPKPALHVCQERTLAVPDATPLFASTYAVAVAAGMDPTGRWAHDPRRSSERSRRIDALARAARASSGVLISSEAMATPFTSSILIRTSGRGSSRPSPQASMPSLSLTTAHRWSRIRSPPKAPVSSHRPSPMRPQRSSSSATSGAGARRSR